MASKEWWIIEFNNGQQIIWHTTPPETFFMPSVTGDYNNAKPKQVTKVVPASERDAWRALCGKMTTALVVVRAELAASGNSNEQISRSIDHLTECYYKLKAQEGSK